MNRLPCDVMVLEDYCLLGLRLVQMIAVALYIGRMSIASKQADCKMECIMHYGMGSQNGLCVWYTKFIYYDVVKSRFTKKH